jgi:hypothetical protein
MARFVFAVPLILLLASVAFAQNPPQSDPQALSLAGQAMAALTNGSPVSDVTLIGSVTWIAGSDNETGTVTLSAKGTGESRVDLNVGGGTLTEIRNDIASRFPQGASVQNGGSQQPWAMHNCWIGASWFFPALSMLDAVSDPTLIFSYVGSETRGGLRVQHIRVYRNLTGPAQSFVALTQAVSTTDVYLDSSTLLPVAVTFYAHPDDDAYTNIATEIDFSNYQNKNGALIPLHLQKFISGGLALDITVTGATLNSGLPDSLFAITQS